MKNSTAKLMALGVFSAISVASLSAHADGRWYKDQYGNGYYYNQYETGGGCPGGQCAAPNSNYYQGPRDNNRQGSQINRNIPPPQQWNQQLSDNEGRYYTKSDTVAIKSDGAIEEEIRNALKKDPKLSVWAQKIQITSQNGHVTITGRVVDVEEKAKVETLANQTSGVKSVKNSVEVKK